MKTCPTCNKSTEQINDNQWLPFCCERCKLIDFGAWLDGSHAIPGEETAIIPDDDFLPH
jgi:hypothetical protein